MAPAPAAIAPGATPPPRGALPMSFPVPTDRSLYVGLMSGTSADGIDAALVDFADPASPRLLATHNAPWPQALRERLVELGQADAAPTLDEVGELDTRVATGFAEAVALLDRKST